MKKIKKILSMILALTLCLSFPLSASAREPDDPTDGVLINEDALGSLTLYKYDLTNAEKDGVWDSSYVSTGVYDQTGVNDILGGATRAGDSDNQSDLGNGEASYGYAIKGVEFSYLKIADIVQFTESDADSRTDNHVEVLYGIDKVKGADFLKTLGLENGAKRYTNADHLSANQYFYQSDVLIDALAAGLEANSTVVKNALETYMAANGGVAMPLTDAYGKTEAHDLELGLYLLVETKVPEMVTSTTDPFLVSVPMTTVNGTNADNGGATWIYDITLYPKNLTGIPTLTKEIKESAADTGKTEEYAHTATASSGDTLDYQIISTLPSITSESTYLSCYTFVDTLSKGLTYTKGDIVLEFFTDAACTDLVTTWKEADGFFSVAYNTAATGESVMTIEMTERGLAEINTSKAVYADATMVNSGFSDCTVRITYTAKMDSDNSVIFGDNGNDNKVVLTWKRTSDNFFDTLVDDCHAFVYGIDLTKMFSDGKGKFENVQFILKNDTDSYYVQAELNADEGIYYVVDHSSNPEDATHFVPVESNGKAGKIIIKGLEDDTYTMTEIRTDNGYVLLKDDIEITIS
ncbi:MAG: SpaH/EbpB family LPXTG-anchored major pilin [Oscillospiraceae bacterium]|nr:SpaH/EbpB family LPXTG-anchored major pilin [Oscillospiraceae bacterium]